MKKRIFELEIQVESPSSKQGDMEFGDENSEMAAPLDFYSKKINDYNRAKSMAQQS